MDNTDNIEQLIRESGLRVTLARITILTLLQKAARPMNVQMILLKLGRKAPDQATIYRIIASFVRAGLVREVQLQSDSVSYEISTLPHHHHLVCERCGFVEDVTTCCEDPKPTTASFHRVTNHNLEYSGICNVCAS